MDNRLPYDSNTFMEFMKDYRIDHVTSFPLTVLSLMARMGMPFNRLRSYSRSAIPLEAILI